MEPVYYIASFDYTAAAIEAQHTVRDTGIRIAIMPTPRTVQASCGLSIRFGVSDLARVKGVLENIIEKEIYHLYAAYKKDGHTCFRECS